MSALRSAALPLFILLSACGSSDGDRVAAKTDLVVGQADFLSGSANQGGSVDATTLNTPADIAVQDNRLYIADSANHRVLGFDAIPSTNNEVADFVIGQTNFTSNTTAATSASSMNTPSALATSTTKLAVSDRFNHRVLVWDSLPAANQPADVVVGQANFTAKAIVCNRSTLQEPHGLVLANGKLIVADTGNNRVLIWNSVPASTSPGEDANIVLGQADFTSCTAAVGSPTQSSLKTPKGVWSDGTILVVNDTGNNRVLIWNDISTLTNFEQADIVLGQGVFDRGTCNDDNGDNGVDANPTARTLCGPEIGVDSDGTQLFISDRNNHRIMVWSTFPTANFQAADVVMGHVTFINDIYNDKNQDGVLDNPDTPSGATLRDPQGVQVSGKLFFITDTNNHRVRIIE